MALHSAWNPGVDGSAPEAGAGPTGWGGRAWGGARSPQDHRSGRDARERRMGTSTHAERGRFYLFGESGRLHAGGGSGAASTLFRLPASPRAGHTAAVIPSVLPVPWLCRRAQHAAPCTPEHSVGRPGSSQAPQLLPSPCSAPRHRERAQSPEKRENYLWFTHSRDAPAPSPATLFRREGPAAPPTLVLSPSLG